MKPTMRDIESVLKRDRDRLSRQDVTDAASRVWPRLGAAAQRLSELPPDQAASAATRRWPARLAAAAVLVIAVVIGVVVVWAPRTSPATVDTTFRVVEGDVRAGETLRSSAAGAVIALADGSRVEMRSLSELALERANDGVRIRLRQGGIIVNAAKQRGGHLYVQTNDVTVSVVGTVFLVNAEAEGSRVAVIEGEVHVQQGAITTNLRSGEQVTTDPRMDSRSVKEEVNWSRDAARHVAVLDQSSVARTAQTPTGGAAPPIAGANETPAFEVAAIRPATPFVPSSRAGRTGGGGARGDGSANRRPIRGCVADSYNLQRLDPRRIYIPTATLFQLLAHAYPVQDIPGIPGTGFGGGGGCGFLGTMGLLVGGPDWVKTDLWDLEAAIPQGAFTTFSPDAATDPRLQRMLLTLLETRFKLVIRRETREQAVYALTVGKDGPKFNGRPDLNLTRGEPMAGWQAAFNGLLDLDERGLRVGFIRPLPALQGVRGTVAINASMEDVAHFLTNGPGQFDRLVVDRTGLPGRYDFYAPSSAVFAQGDIDSLGRAYETAKRDLMTAVGLELQEARLQFDVWVIERAEKPSEN